MEESERIVDFIMKKIPSLEELIEISQESISLLNEHRTALISAAVTGKIDVRDQQ